MANKLEHGDAESIYIREHYALRTCHGRASFPFLNWYTSWHEWFPKILALRPAAVLTRILVPSGAPSMALHIFSKKKSGGLSNWA